MNRKIDKPYKEYNGSKEVNGLYQSIINLIPPHKTYIEPFVGNGCVFRMKKFAQRTVINDLDRSVYEKWVVLIDKFDYEDRQKISITNLPARAVIDKYDCSSGLIDIFVYLDPPYLKSTRCYKPDIYKHEMTMKDHEDLLSRIRTVNFNCMISCYDNELYSSMLNGWNKQHFKAITHRGKITTETVYFNYQAPTVLHDYNYLGNDFIERQRIKRKIIRWTNRLKQLPALERNSIIESLIQ